MNFKKKEGQIDWRVMLSRGAIILITALSIITFLPRDNEKGFHYDVGKPWMYGSFIARFDFPIYKNDELLKSEQDSILRSFHPYYKLNAEIEYKQVQNLEQAFPKGFPGLPYEYLRIITNRLHRVYQAGIMSTKEYNELNAKPWAQVRIINAKNTDTRDIAYMYSTRSAYEQLFIDDELGELRQALQECNLNEYIEPNIIFDSERTESERSALLASIPATNGMVITGQKIIDRGEIVDDYTARVIDSFEKERSRRSKESAETRDTMMGQSIFVCMVVLLFTLYLSLFRRDYFEDPRSIGMLYLLVAIFPIMVSFVMKHSFFSVYIIPFCIVPIFVRFFMDSRTAFMTHMVMILICAAAVTYQYEFIIIQLVAGVVAIYSLREMTRRAQVLKTAFLVAVASIIVYFALQMMQSNELQKMDSDMYYHFIVNGVLLLLSYPSMYLIEQVFGFTSDVTLIELSNTNKGALRDLSEIAPGTFQHSITVGNLAAEIANKIGAESLLVRTGALYHDIGKMENPVFFTENQAGVNPHETLSYVQSAQMITGHITNGISLAEHYDLPKFIKDFILTHHGKGVAKYFYVKQKNEHPDEEVSIEQFSYTGPNPFTREQAILMMADATEAASHSLEDYTEESISNMVNRIIDGQVADGFFTECPITFRDISMAKQVLIERLKSIYHTRISYPKTQEEVEQDIEDAIEKTLQQNDKATD